MKFYNNKLFVSILLVTLLFLQGTNAIAIPLEKRAYSTLKQGSKGDAVKKLQEKLISLGYTLGSYGADGDYGQYTKFSVYAFQQVNGLLKDGIAGNETQTTLYGKSPKRNIVNGDETDSTTYGTLKRGSQGDLVKRLQLRLLLLGYNVGSYGIDGQYGKDTLNAVKSFQSNNNLESCDGVADAATQKILFSKEAVNAANMERSSLTRFVNTALQEYNYHGVLYNTGRLSKFGVYFGVNPGHWCAMFVSWVGIENQSTASHTIVKTTTVTNIMNAFDRESRFVLKQGYKPKYGDIMIIKGNGNSHVAIVVGSSNEYVWTIEGNYSNAVNVVRRRLDSSKITGYGKNGSSSTGYKINGSIVKID